jgi:CHASE3 domain sensor protein/anti-anti-sigma regulatory factor
MGQRNNPLMIFSGERLRTALVVASIALILGASALTYRTIAALIAAQGWVDHTESVIDHIDRLSSKLREAELSTSVYVIFGKDETLASYHEGSRAIPEELKQLRALTVDNPHQGQRLDALQPLIDGRLQALATLIEARKIAPAVPPTLVEQLDLSSASRGGIRALLGEMVNEENQLYLTRREKADDEATVALRLVIGVTAIASISTCVVLYLMTAEVRRRRAAEVGLNEANATLEQRVAERAEQIARQQEVIHELSTPVLQFRDGLLILPLVGLVDTARARQLTDDLLRAIRANRAKAVVIDITGVPAVDSRVAGHLAQTVEACRLMGVAAIVTGISGAVAEALVRLGVDIAAFSTMGDLQRGIEAAERLLGYRTVQTNGAAGVVGLQQ